MDIDHTYGSPVKSMAECARSTTDQMIGDAGKGTVALYNLGWGDPTAHNTDELVLRKGHKLGPATCNVGFELNSVMFGIDKIQMQADRDAMPKVIFRIETSSLVLNLCYF